MDASAGAEARAFDKLCGLPVVGLANVLLPDRVPVG
jgi:hypothetical protein